MKNLFAVVRALAMQTTTDRPAAEYRDVLLDRLEATLRAEEIAIHEGAANFETLLKRSVGQANADRIQCKGSELKLRSKVVAPSSMIFHELTTNAFKYGAFSVPDGTAHVSWTLEDGPKNRKYLVCTWQERDGTAVAQPSRTGYGTELMRGTSSHLGGSVEHIYNPTGLSVTIKIPV
ncbi:sensor histidine kinase [Rhizobium sp. NFR07]|uniref:sensor histidine kinase n=1 Tax=Rhizobium sp. NFR07 TaxID=1566262 RepID=UPI00329A3A5E